MLSLQKVQHKVFLNTICIKQIERHLTITLHVEINIIKMAVKKGQCHVVLQCTEGSTYDMECLKLNIAKFKNMSFTLNRKEERCPEKKV